MGLFGQSREERQEEQRITIRKIVDEIITTDKLRDRIIKEVATRWMEDNNNAQIIEEKMDAAVRAAVEKWTNTIGQKFGALIREWMDDPLIMREMRRMQIDQEDFIEETRKQLNELAHLVRGLLGSSEDRKQNPILTEILERLEVLERRAGIASPGPR